MTAAGFGEEPFPSRRSGPARRTHEWAWGDVGRRTVCGLIHMQIERALIVSDLGAVELRKRCRNCDRLRAVYGTSSRPVAPPPEPGPVPQASPAAVAEAGPLDERERDILEHTTGWKTRWPLYRNHFCASPGHDAWPVIERLIARGLMRKTREPSDLSGGDTVFNVTGLGIAALKKRKTPVGSEG